MSKVEIRCLMCSKKFEAEPGKEGACPKCGATFKLKSEEELNEIEKNKKSDEKSEYEIYGDLKNIIYECEEKEDYETMAKTARQMLEIEDEVSDGWAYLAIAEAKMVEKLIDENNFRDNEKYEEIDTYFEKAYEYEIVDGETDKIRPIHVEFLRKNMLHANELRIQEAEEMLKDLTKSLNNEVEGEDVYAKVPTENKEFYIKQLPDYIEKLKKDNELIKILDDEDTIKVAKSAMIKNETKNEDNDDEDEDEE
ncbi:MAG: hypothetical protein J6C13_03290 [Clostridia bacterium]|nr:hypothetical protein [Clostridia bacterium]